MKLWMFTSIVILAPEVVFSFTSRMTIELELYENTFNILQIQDERCTTQNTKIGICKPMTLCSTLSVEINYESGSQENACSDANHVCCPVPSLEKPCTNFKGKEGICLPPRNCSSIQNSLKHPSNKEFIIRSQEGCDSSENQRLVCCANKKPLKMLESPHCGTEINDKIVGGTPSALNEFPWTALLAHQNLIQNDTKQVSKKIFHCGGSLISSRYVLTGEYYTEFSNRERFHITYRFFRLLTPPPK